VYSAGSARPRTTDARGGRDRCADDFRVWFLPAVSCRSPRSPVPRSRQTRPVSDHSPRRVPSTNYRRPSIPMSRPSSRPNCVRPPSLSPPPSPFLVSLPGNPAACGRFAGAGPGRFAIGVLYTFTGTCPAGFVVAPSHEGYAYLADRLASWGYIVVSINANRGVNAAPGVVGDAGLNLRRGRLVLRHLQKLAAWNAGSESTPATMGF